MTRVREGGRWQLQFDFVDSVPSTTPATSSKASSTVAVCEVSEPAPVSRRKVSRPTSRGDLLPARRSRAVLPVPKPLEEAVEAGHFGRDEADRPIRPGRQEIRAITECHAEVIKEALLQHQTDEFEAGIAKYAESFGDAAADRLQAYCLRMAEVDTRTTPAWRR